MKCWTVAGGGRRGGDRWKPPRARSMRNSRMRASISSWRRAEVGLISRAVVRFRGRFGALGCRGRWCSSWLYICIRTSAGWYRGLGAVVMALGFPGVA